MLITVEQFTKLFPLAKTPEEWTAALNAILPKYRIDTPQRLAAFLAQCGHESCGFTSFRENLNYSATALATTWPNRYADDPKATVKTPNDLAQRLHRQPEAIANNAYAGRMGNGPEESGDGWRFRGYGPIQITGRGNRTTFAHSIGQTLEESEAYLLTPAGGIESACWYWATRNINPLADAGNTLAVTKAVNGGTIGLDDRKTRYAQACTVLAA